MGCVRFSAALDLSPITEVIPLSSAQPTAVIASPAFIE
jgi:hypothetical protein